MTENYKFFQNKSCEYFPCHAGVSPDKFNCMFCYCPLYALGNRCGGNFKYTKDGVKDCSDCVIPHTGSGYDYIVKHPELINKAGEKTKDKE